MALDRNGLIALAKATAKASLNPSASFAYEGKNLTYAALNETFRNEMNALAGTYADYRRNQNTIFELIETGIDEVLPQKVLQEYGQFADVRTVAQGDKLVFKVRISEASKRRAKGFVTRVGLAGRYETFKLDGYSFEVPTSAWGGAAQIGFEEFLDGNIQMSDVYDIVLEGLDEAVYKEIAKALESMIETVGEMNKVEGTTFDEQAFDQLLQTADVYGKAAIYCTFEFATKMMPTNSEWYSSAMKEARFQDGYFANYKGHNVVILPQSFEDATNKVKVIDPSHAYIIPTGAEKPVKVAFEGQSAVREVPSQEDWSREIQTYRKFGVAVFQNVNPGICVYTDTSLKKNMSKPVVSGH